MKSCARCGKLQALSAFPMRPGGRQTKTCRTCQVEKVKATWAARRGDKCPNCGDSIPVDEQLASTMLCKPCRRQRKLNSARDATCGFCATAFRSIDKGGAWTRYCSPECGIKAKTGLHRNCENCGKLILAQVAADSTRTGHRFCSVECKNTVMQGSLASNWQGGVWKMKTGEVRQYIGPVPGKVGRYAGRHRVVCAAAIGRLLERHEVVLHVDNRRGNDDAANLFICGSQSEAQKRIHGSLPWPTKSNLSTYERSSPRVPRPAGSHW